MRILYVAMKDDYGDPARGRSFEHCNFHAALRGMGFDLLYFDPVAMVRRRGRDATNRRLLEVVRSERPDVLFCVLFTNELDPRVMSAISRDSETRTVNWFCDDHWRFDDFTFDWAPAFNFSVTTASGAVPKYEAMGYEGVIKSQWAVNHFEYRKIDAPLEYDVSFVGQPHGCRKELLDALSRLGIEVRAWGHGWDDGRIDQPGMIDVFNRSRINLNLSNASVAPARSGSIESSRPYRMLARLPGGRYPCAALRRAERLGRQLRRPDPMDTLRSIEEGYIQQIKARNFEVPGCGGFLLSGDAAELESYYEPGREIAVYRDPLELLDLVRHYLDHEDERRAVAEAGYERTVREHTYAHRFDEIFRRMGAAAPPLEALLAGGRGTVVEIE